MMLSQVKGSYVPWFDVHLSDIGCKYVYFSLIPTFNADGDSILFRGIIDILTAIAVPLFVWYKSRRDITESIQYLLPFYRKVLWIYVIVVGISGIFHFIKYFANDDEKSIGIAIFRAIDYTIISGIQILMFFIIIQNSTMSTKLLIKSLMSAICVGIIAGTLELFQHFFGYMQQQFTLYCILSIFINALLPVIILTVLFCKVKPAYNTKSDLMQRRKRLIYVYSFLMCAILLFSTLAFILLSFRIDGYCLDSVTWNSFRFIFPFLLIYTMRKDNAIWTDYMSSMSGIYAEIKQKGSKKQRKVINNENSMGRLALNLLRTKCKVFRLDQLDGLNSRIVGTGGKAEVRECRLKNDDNRISEIVAVKELRYDGNDNFSPEDKVKNISEYINEAWTVSSMRHPNIVELKGACLDVNRFGKNPFYLVYEHCNQGDLIKFLKLKLDTQNIIYDFRTRLNILLDVAKGMDFLHSENVVHRDLSPQNILVHYDADRKEYIAKVCDFGDCTHLKSHLDEESMHVYDYSSMSSVRGAGVSVVSSVRGKSEYRDPAYDELKDDETFNTTPSELRAVDVWAFGKIMWEVWCCVIVMKEDGKNMEIPSFEATRDDFNLDKAAYRKFTRLIGDCWQRDQLNRPSFKKIIQVLENVKKLCRNDADEEKSPKQVVQKQAFSVADILNS